MLLHMTIKQNKIFDPQCLIPGEVILRDFDTLF